MDAPTGRPKDGPSLARPYSSPLWNLALLALLAWHGWMTLSLFGPNKPWRGLFDARPILSGLHPLHLYHGMLGATCFRERGSLCCYDPAFQAGYPKTPVFDSGSRPAELFLMLAGGRYSPAAYKIGLALCCMLAPFLLLASARGLGLGRDAACVVVGACLFVWWGTPCRRLLETGDLDVLLASLAGVGAVSMLVYFHRTPGFRSWTGLVLFGSLGCFAQPLLLPVLFPLLLVYYLTIGARHRLGWHMALFGALATVVLANGFWLPDWVCSWWLRSPLRVEVPLVPHRTIHTLWSAPLWGDNLDRLVAGVLVLAAIPGVVLFNHAHERATARMFGLGAGGFLLLALAGLASESIGRVGTPRLLVPALWFATLPAAHALALGFRCLVRLAGGPWRGAALAGSVLGAAGFAARGPAISLAPRYFHAAPLKIGLDAQEQAVVEAIRSNTTPEARILWEDRTGDETLSRWTALLPVLTQRAYLGGFDPERCIDYSYPTLVDQKLAGKAIGAWQDANLACFCRNYNAGWVVCRSPAVVKRFQQWPEAKLVALLKGQEGYYLFSLPAGSFALKGQARVLEADYRHLSLVDLVPENGQVVLSMHYQTGLRASPSRVQIEKEPDASDPIPFIRLRLDGPAASVTLTWDKH